MSNNKMIVALLGVVAVLLAVIAGLLIFKGSTPAVPDATATVPSTTATSPTMPSTTPPAAPFDPAKAPKVPPGVTPSAFVEDFFKALMRSDWKTAYAELPLDKQQSYGSVDAFGQQLKTYGATGYTMGKTSTSGKDVTVEATLKTPQMSFLYKWTLEKYKNGYVVKSRTVGGMGN